jgi:uncharacterized protein involved in exopolysaccharide biosynthesis
MLKIDSEIQELEAARSREASTVVGTVTSETNPTRRYFDTETETTLVHIEGLIRRNEALSRPAEELRRRIREVSTGFDAYESAEREYKTAEQIYLSYGQRLQEAQMSEELDARRVANVVAIGQPERPTLPSAPNRIFLMEIAMAAALVLGIGLAALLETTEDRILGERSVLDMDNVAYLGTVKISRTA